ncbi:hypothetical protein AALA69_06360 [Eggerthellaceae bacterium 24-137]
MQRQNSNDSARRIGDVLEDVIRGQSVKPRPLGTDGLRTGLRAVDDVLGDLPYCETVGVVGRWEVVTDALLTIARNAASMGASVLYCTKRDLGCPSESSSGIALALAAAVSQVPFTSLLDGSYNEGEARAFDRAIKEVKSWDIRLIEHHDRPKDFLRTLCLAIGQKLGTVRAPAGKPRLIVIDSLSEAHLPGWQGATLAEAFSTLDEISVQWGATLIFGLAGERFACGLNPDSSLPGLIYATIELVEQCGCDQVLRPRLTICGEKCTSNQVLLARNADFRSVDDILEPSSGAVGGRGVVQAGRAFPGAGEQGDGPRPLFPGERLMRHEIMQTATPFMERVREASVATRDEQWRVLRNWAYRGCPDMALELRDFEAFVAYEIGFEKEADSSYRSKGLCKILHDRAMARASCSDELKTQLLLALLSAFSFMDERVNGGEGERPVYRLCG